MVELIWDGKYDADGKRVSPLRVALPFQTVETVNESAQQRQKSLFDMGARTEWRNRLIWGDKKYVLPSLLPELAGKVDLIYIDPPFATGADFSFQAQVGDESFEKQPSIIEQKAYRDTWGRGLDGYLQWFYETAVMLYELLSDKGSLYVHLDSRVSHYVKLLVDDIFNRDRFQNEIIWLRSTGHSDSHRWNHSHDNILFYSKGIAYQFSTQYLPYTDRHIVSSFKNVEESTGRRYSIGDLMASGLRNGATGRPWRGIDPAERNAHWQYKPEKLDELDAEGRIYWPEKGRVPRLKRYLDEMKGMPAKSIWDDIPPVQGNSQEKTGYPTQKPEALLERIIRASSNEGDLVLDCFCGSGTTAAVAEKLGRRWITCDLGRFAIHTARKRLLAIPDVKPFVVQNLGKYERQVWQTAEFGEKAETVVRQYRHFILDLYRAERIDGYAWLHGVRDGRMVHVGGVDSPVSAGDVQQIAIEAKRAKVVHIDILGWDFALDMNETMRQQADAAGIKVRFVRIPREVLEKKAVEQGDIHFYELAALGVDVRVKGMEVTVTLNDFMVSPDDVPQDVLDAVKHWSEWIDYWALDFNFRDDTFHNEWQSYRTRKERKLSLEHTHRYTQAGRYTLLVKVIDILGNDTTKAIEVEVRG